jgi:trimeric autotransporter adhesin
MFITVVCFAQLTGIKTIPGSYPTLYSAVTALNAQGVGAGGVIFNITPGHTETTPAGGIVITATGTAANPIIFQKSGLGINPKITTTDAGAVSTSVFGGQGDAVIIIQGSDYVTFNGLDVSATQSGIEYGYYLRKASGTNGCKNVSITNANITLTKGTSAYVVGIYSSNNSDNSSASSAAGITVTSAGGINENISFTNNVISNVFSGIAVIGYNAPSPYSLYDQNYTIGSNESGNIIQNFAGNAVAAAYGIYMLYIKNASINYNTINNSGNGGTAATSTLSGIYFDTNTSSAGIYVANNNTITLSQSSTAAVNFIYNGSTITSFTANSNSFGAGSFASTIESYLIYNYSTTTSSEVNNNYTVGNINKTGGGNFTCYFQSGGIQVGGTATCSGNNFSNITVTGYFNFSGIISSNISSQILTITNNTISNITGNGTNTMNGLIVSYGQSNSVIKGNIISGLSGAYTIYGLSKNSSVNQSSIDISENTVSDLTALDLVYGMNLSDIRSTNIYKNKIYGLSATSNTGKVYGMLIGGNASPVNVYNNLIGNLNTPAVNSLEDVIRALQISSQSTSMNFNIYFNTIYLNATTSGANFSTSAIYHVVNTNPTVGALNLINNIIINTSTAKGSGKSVVLRRSGSTINNYSSTSNNNLLYAGVPSASNVLYFDGLNFSQTLAEFKSYVAPRESASVTELPVFISTTGNSPYFLHIAPGTTTQANNGGQPIATVTDDFDGQLRNTLTPDIGADEFEAALPITLQYLKGLKTGTGNALNWKVNCTSVSITMELERSADSRSFKSITSITASQARCGQPFDYVDAAPLKGTNYYRLKMIDVDGKVTYSPIVAIINGSTSAELVGIYPTVVTDQAFLSVAASRTAKMQINITDMSGRIIKTISQTVANGSSLININTANLSAGVYNITGMLDGVQTKTLRFVKQ